MKGRKTLKIWLPIGIIIVLISAGATAFALHSTKLRIEQNGIPADVRDETSFVIFAPNSGVIENSAKYNTISDALSYRMSTSPEVTVSQQVVPTQFVDIDGYEEKFYSGLNQYDTIQTNHGLAHLVRPSGETSDVAVFNQEGTLVFITAKASLSPERWRSLINTLEVVAD